MPSPRPPLGSPPVAPAVPGFRLRRPLGVGAGGVVWAGVDERDPGRRTDEGSDESTAESADECSVAVKVVDPVRTDELAALRGVQHRHVVPLIADVLLPDGRVALVLERVRGGSLARLVTARGHLTPGETVTVVTTLATTVADLAAIGLTHGDLSPGNVLFHADGRPMLSDLGVARIAGLAPTAVWGTAGFVDPAVLAGGAPGLAAETYALGALGWYCLTGEPPVGGGPRPALAVACPGTPEALAAALDAALDPDPSRRPDPSELARRVFAAAPAEPVPVAAAPAPDDPAAALTHRIRTLAAADGPMPSGRGRRRQPRGWRRRGLRRWARGAVLLLVVVGLLVGLWLWRPTASAAPTPVVAPVAPPAWGAVVAALGAARADAFAQPERGPAGFDQPGSPAWHRDAAALEQLHVAGLSYTGLTISAGDVEVVARGADETAVRVSVQTSAYTVVTARPGPATHVPQSAQVVVLHLVRTGAGWRVRDFG